MEMTRDVSRESEMLANCAMAVPRVRAWRLQRDRAQASISTGAPESLDRYAFQALRDIEDVTGSVTGREIIEYGPGDTLSAGLVMLAAGAKSYISLNRFVADYASPKAKVVCICIISRPLKSL